MTISKFNNLARRLDGDRRGNVAVVAALAMPVVLGAMGLGAEVASWYGGKRALQNAADSAAVAAATNGSDSYAAEARAVAAQYGYKDGTDGVKVVTSNTAGCPDGSGDKCISVQINRPQRLLLAQVIGFGADTTIDGAPAKLIQAKAIATQAAAPREYCVLALASSGTQQGLRTNGAPKGDLTGCNVASNTDAVCNGHDLQADIGDAVGINTGCGKKRNSHIEKVADPYAKLASKIPEISCPDGYQLAPKKKKDAQLEGDNLLGGADPRKLIPVCGDGQLTSDLYITQPNTVMVVKNGSLDVKEWKVTTMPGASLTIIFTGDDKTRDHIPLGTGGFDFAAPTTGDWKGVAMYQDPTMAAADGLNISEAGNTPTWDITGLVYLPHSSVTFSGVVNKSSNGASCFGLVVDNLTVNGTGSILAHGECGKAGLDLPYSIVPARGQLVG